MLSRNESYSELQKYVQNRNLLKHMLSTEAVMLRLAGHFGEDPEVWGLAGLLHDIDYEETKDQPEVHGLKGAEVLAELGFPEEMTRAVKAHNERLGVARESLLEKALYATDPLTGLIVAGALIRPEKKLAAIDVPFLRKRFDEKSFARGAKREQILACDELGLTLEEFLGLGLEAMQGIAEELGL
ncbi:HD/PDEase domain protein [Acididesulfobacillus acetoxydans]|uniref:HD/PDEase domain protein n=1 Tax=Acididesulfobacillus acetoxydans TaxID=1561005 RepID=A0A8S0XAC0_9FIRM|nr:HDIG domain-containing metalloprotein [Acididesulfobacillus acetoxydans]CAA7599676.1 HD/PDEase domain protein [Acididesulfobacillus acetoxydans]CEJ06228.1 Metal dependent phosphohydrolase [Acididesulfobacillus acetoxydans]